MINNKNINSKLKINKEDKKTWFSNNPVSIIMIKSSFIVIFFVIVIRYIDEKGYFNPDERNNHTKRKWNSFYEFTKKNDVDVLLLGNSHLYSGINPKNLSSALGCNAFILASPGTHIADSYYGLKEALKRTDAKLVVVETYGMNNFNPYKLKEEELSDQFKSFYARKDFSTKLTSTPFLFSSDHYFYAWSNTLRNHDFIFNDTLQISINKKLIKRKIKNNKRLYLGRFVRFQTGIEKQIMSKYDSLGAPVKGKEYSYNHYTEKYIDKIVNLCKNKNIELIFLTLPMYERHISDYDKWEEKLAGILKKYPNKWLNMQKRPGYDEFGPYAFENTYKANQHMTYNGSLLASYKLAKYIRDSLQMTLPRRKEENKWHQIFYGEEGYFENYNPSINDRDNKVICANKVLRNVKLNNLLQIGVNSERASRLIAKVDKRTMAKTNDRDNRLRIVLRFEMKGKEQIASVDLLYDTFHRPEHEAIFTATIKPLKIHDVVSGLIVQN